MFRTLFLKKPVNKSHPLPLSHQAGTVSVTFLYMHNWIKKQKQSKNKFLSLDPKHLQFMKEKRLILWIHYNNGIKNKTDLIVPGTVQITDQAPVVINHTIENFKVSHDSLFHWRNPTEVHKPPLCPAAPRWLRCSSMPPWQRLQGGERESSEGCKGCISVPICEASRHLVICGQRPSCTSFTIC